MERIFLATLLAAFAAVQTAQAVPTYSFDCTTATIEAASHAAGVYTFDGLSAPLVGPGSVSTPSFLLNFSDDTRILNDSSGVGAKPYAGSGNYLSVGAVGSAELLYSADQSSLSFLWGSIDAYNSVEFYLDGAVNPVFSLTAVSGYNGYQGEGGSGQFVITNILFDRVVFRSNGTYAFEIDNINSSPSTTAVPDGGVTVILLGLALGGLALIRRKVMAVL